MNENRKYQPPERTKSDGVHTLTKAGLSGIPVFGGPASELFSAIVTPPLEKRRHEWMEEIGEALRRLEKERGIKFEELRDNPLFIDCVMHASHAALRNSQTQKRRALRNALLNSALPGAPEYTLQMMYINFIDSFTDWHIHILNLFDNPPEWFKANEVPPPNIEMGPASTILESGFPEMKSRRELYEQIWRDLYSRGLVKNDTLNLSMNSMTLFQSHTTDMGKGFLKYIKDPI